MTSTGVTVGLDGTRVSSKVLKPPGGGSSDIFGLGNSQLPVSNGGEKKKEPETTQNRLFGTSDSLSSIAKTNRMQSNVFANETVVAPRSAKKRYVRRNPITGEEIEINAENVQEQTNGEEKNDKDETAEEKEVEVPDAKPVQTSIRVRQPPGGKSSGIF
ncbi:hypothetical protein X975_09200, partial [Stegodyphus mimosarum]